MVSQRQAALDAHVEILLKIAGRRGKSVAALDSQIASMLIAKRRKALDDGCERVGRLDDDIDVDRRLGSESWDRRAADVLHRHDKVSNAGKT
jgi:hypothetical protein